MSWMSYAVTRFYTAKIWGVTLIHASPRTESIFSTCFPHQGPLVFQWFFLFWREAPTLWKPWMNWSRRRSPLWWWTAVAELQTLWHLLIHTLSRQRKFTFVASYLSLDGVLIRKWWLMRTDSVLSLRFLTAVTSIYANFIIMQQLQVVSIVKVRHSGGPDWTIKLEDCSIGQSAVVWVRKPNFGSFCCGKPFACFFFYCPVASDNFSLLAAAHDCETDSYSAVIALALSKAETKALRRRNPKSAYVLVLASDFWTSLMAAGFL